MQDRQFDDLVARFRGACPPAPSPAGDPAGEAIERALMQPLSPERAAGILDRVVGPPAAPVAPLAHARRSRWNHRLAVPFVFAAAAAVFLVVRGPGSPPANDPVAEVDTGLYNLEIHGARGETRGNEALATFAPGDRLRLRLRPRDGISEPITTSVRAVHGDVVIPLAWSVRSTSARGHQEIDGALSDLLAVAPGVWELEVLVQDARDAPLWRGRSRIRVIAATDPQ